jgi:hypothetical protein
MKNNGALFLALMVFGVPLAGGVVAMSRPAAAQEPITEILLCGVKSNGPEVTAYYTLGLPCPNPNDSLTGPDATIRAKLEIPSALCTWVIYVQPGEAMPFTTGTCPNEDQEIGTLR